jgi:hypothetical protein
VGMRGHRFAVVYVQVSEAYLTNIFGM